MTNGEKSGNCECLLGTGLWKAGLASYGMSLRAQLTNQSGPGVDVHDNYT